MQKRKSFYAQLKLNFTEAVNWINTQNEVEEFAKIMDNFVSSIKEKYKQVHANSKHTSQQIKSPDNITKHKNQEIFKK